MATGVASWSKTAATNASADSAINWAEGQAPSSVNDSARALMASVAKWRDDICGTITTGGTSTAYTVTTNQVFATASAMSGAMICFIPNADSGASPTLAVDGLTARAINISTGVAIPSGALKSGTPYVVTYIHASTEFILQGQLAVNPLTGVDIIGATALTAPATDDSLPIYDLSATANRKIAASDFLKVVGSLTSDTAPDVAADFVLSFDTSASSAKKIPLANLPTQAPQGFLFGLTCSNGSDATNDIDISAGSCRDSTNAVTITLSAITKQLDSSWSAGTNAGGRSSSSLANTTWHIFAIAKADGTADVLFHDAIDPSSVLPSGYTYYRRIWSVIRSSGSIISFKQFGDDCFFNAAITDVNSATASATAALVTISVPAGLKVKALLSAAVINSGVGSNPNSAFLWISSPDVSDQSAGTGRPTIGVSITPSSGTITSAGAGGECQTYTNTSSQVRVVSSTPLGTQTYSIITRGYTDTRGRLF